MRELLNDVLHLQPNWDADDRAFRESRSKLVTKLIPDALRSKLISHPGLVGLSVEGSNGMGRSAKIAWVRVYDPALSPSATEGWYVVYLFAHDGSVTYLTLMHSSMRIVKGGLAIRPRVELEALVDWARAVLGNLGAHRPGLILDIDLRAPNNDAAVGYEQSAVCAFAYELDNIPDEQKLVEDLLYLTGLAQALQNADRELPVLPGRDPFEEAYVGNLIDELGGKSRRGSASQGFGLSASERKAVELQAEYIATKRLESHGWLVENVGATRSYDLHCTSGPDELLVEVKGTTGHEGRVILTHREVELHRATNKRSALFIVSKIRLQRDPESPRASGGKLREIYDWEIDPIHLEPLAYYYTPPTSDDKQEKS